MVDTFLPAAVFNGTPYSVRDEVSNPVIIHKNSFYSYHFAYCPKGYCYNLYFFLILQDCFSFFSTFHLSKTHKPLICKNITKSQFPILFWCLQKSHTYIINNFYLFYGVLSYTSCSSYCLCLNFVMSNGTTNYMFVLVNIQININKIQKNMYLDNKQSILCKISSHFNI